MALPIDPLTAEAIQALRAQGFTQAKISSVLNVSRSTILRCINPTAKETNAECARRRRTRTSQPLDPLF